MSCQGSVGGTSILVSTVAAPFRFLSHSAQGFSLLHIFANTCSFLLLSNFSLHSFSLPSFFDSSHPDRSGVVSHCGLGLHFLMIRDAEPLFMGLLAICVCVYIYYSCVCIYDIICVCMYYLCVCIYIYYLCVYITCVYILFGKMSIQVLCPFLVQLLVFCC